MNKPPLASPYTVDLQPAAERLAQLLRRWDEMTFQRSDTSERRALLADIRAVGTAAAMLGSFGAMTALDDATRRTGVSTSDLNRLWDGIGGWMA